MDLKSLLKRLFALLAITTATTVGVRGSLLDNDRIVFNKTTCAGAGMCARKSDFCQPFYYRAGGVCEPCWKCCAFLKVGTESLVFDTSCVGSCRCAEDGVNFCDSAWECGEGGMFCDHKAGGFCKSCIHCDDDTCARDCQGFVVDEHINDRTMYIAKAHAYYQTALAATRNSKDAFDAFDALQTHERTECPQLYGLGREAVRVTSNGCPCSPWNNATQLRCPIGHVCVSRNSASAESDAILNGAGTWLGAVCEPCREGSLCDRDGLVGSATVIECPSGYYCPTPSKKIVCPPGAFCQQGGVVPKTCDYETLLMRESYITTPPKLVLQRILFDLDPFRGNYCPGGLNGSAAVPMHVCPAGFYCPNASAIFECPSGYFCRKQSMAPVKCPVLTRCPDGTSAPEWSGIVIVFYMLLGLLGVLGKFVKFAKFGKFGISFKWLRGVASCIIESCTIQDDPISYPLSNIESVEAAQHQSEQLKDIAYCGSLITPVVSIKFENLSARQAGDANAHPWLWPNSGEILSQKLNAVMGSSGCGKSTLIEMVRGRVHAGVLTGRVIIEDGLKKRLDFSMDELASPNSSVRAIRKLIGFVPQDDVLLGDLTVRENLVYSAALKLPEFKNKNGAIEYIVDCVCEKLGFDAKLQNRVVGTVDRRGISGGQRKRVSIGMELVGLHPIIMMDEPTSGLDASGSHTLLNFAKYITHMGCTIIAVVHQPRCSSFLLFDQIILLSRYGCAFCGSPFEAVAYYERGMLAGINVDDNPGDAIMDLLTYGVVGAMGGLDKTGDGRVIQQQEQAALWSGAGIEWQRRLRAAYPLFDHMMASSISYNGDIEHVLASGLVRNERLCADLLILFENSGIFGVSVNDVKSFFSNNQISDVESLVRAIKRICWSNVIKGSYDNTILKMGLLAAIPPSFLVDRTHDPNLVGSGANLRANLKALEFGRRLMRKAGIPSRGSCMGLAVLEREILLLVLTIKARVDMVRAKQVYSDTMHMRYVLTDAKLEGLVSGGQTKHSVWRNTVAMFKPIGTLVKRKLISVSRSPWLIQLLVPAIAALIVGLIHGSDWNVTAFPSNIVMAMACIGVLSMVTHVRTFSLDKLFIRREVQNNVSLFAYYMAYNIVDIIWILAIPLVFFIPYYYFTFPLSSLLHFYTSGLLVCWWASGLAYVLSASPLALHWTNLIGVFIAVIFGAFIHGLNPTVSEVRGTATEWLIGLSYNRWAMENLVIREMATRQHVMPNVVFASMQRLGLCEIDRYADLQNLNTKPKLDMVLMALRLLGNDSQDVVTICKKHLVTANMVLFCQGLGWRIVAFVMMWTSFDTMVQRNITRLKNLFGFRM